MDIYFGGPPRRNIGRCVRLQDDSWSRDGLTGAQRLPREERDVSVARLLPEFPKADRAAGGSGHFGGKDGSFRRNDDCESDRDELYRLRPIRMSIAHSMSVVEFPRRSRGRAFIGRAERV